MKRAVLLLVVLASASAGCRSIGERTEAEASAVPVAECPVCAAEGDLACLRVKVRPDTPSAEYRGRTYWFCSDECKAEFLAHAAQYAGLHAAL